MSSADNLASALAKITACWSPAFSPDGQQIAFISDLTGMPQVWIVSVDGGWPTLVTALNDPVSKVRWSPDGQWLAVMAAPDGGMNEQVYVVRPDGSDLRLITSGGSETNRLGSWIDAHTLSIASARERPESLDAFTYDLDTDQFKLIARTYGTGALEGVKDGKALVSRVEKRSDSNLYLIDLDSGTETLLTPHDGPGSFTSPDFSPDGSSVYLLADFDRDRIALGAIKLDADGKPGPITYIAWRDDADLDQFAFSKDRSRVALLWNVDGVNELTFLDPVSGKQQPAPPMPGTVIRELGFSPDDQQLKFVAQDAALPRSIWLYTLATNEMRQLTQSAHPGIALNTLVEPELVKFPAEDGVELSGWLYRPHDAAAPGPCILSFHGGPEGQERPTFDATYQALLAAGIAVFAPNVRGSTGFGKTFVNLDNGPLRVNGIRDIKDCVNFVVNAGVAAPGQIGIMGGSYGGYMTMAGLTSYPELFSAGVNLYGVYNFQTFFAQTEAWMAAISKVKYGSPETELALLDSLSPSTHIDAIRAPTLVLHGATDTNVPVIEAEQVVEHMTRLNVPVEYILFPDEGHGFVKEKTRVRATTSIVGWFVQHLQRSPQSE